MTRLFTTAATLTLALFVSLAAVGCGDSRDRSGAPTVSNSGPPSSNPNPGSNVPGTSPPPPAQGVVGQLTGDPDGEVSPQLQNLVATALARGDADDPLEGF